MAMPAGTIRPGPADYPGHADLFRPGGFGENLTIDGLEETDLCVGDCHRIGSAVLQVCQPRQPCFKFALRFADNRMPKAIGAHAASGAGTTGSWFRAC